MFCDTDDTIAAIASASGGAARGIVRVAGGDCISVVSQVFEASAPQLQIDHAGAARRLQGAVAAGPLLGRVPADLLIWPGARSYTRQPAAEIHTFGSPPLLNAILARLCECGARIARPGEFTLRAFLAGRIDLVQAEAVLGVIDARDQRELSVALSQLAGGMTGSLNELRSCLLDLLAHLEAGLDFVEEDIQFIAPAELARQLEEAAGLLEALADQMQRRGTAHALPRVVLAGTPNVGKRPVPPMWARAVCSTLCAALRRRSSPSRRARRATTSRATYFAAASSKSS
jgi:tRNA modification GTPase